MKESFLHWVWEQQLLNTRELYTTNKKLLTVFNSGNLNTLQGPDFSSALLKIESQKWAGNVEIHVKSSDWYAHQHQNDENYKNVILHVVYEHDVEVYDAHNNVVPTLELKKYIDKNVLKNYQTLMQTNTHWIFCEEKINTIDTFVIENWLERVYVERLERKVKQIEQIYHKSGKDWEATLFLTLAKYFGGNLNGEIFLNAFCQVDFSVIRKQMVNKTLDALLFGLVSLLDEKEVEDVYYQQLQKEFAYQKQKYQIENLANYKLHFYGCRPQNFPTIRLAQLLALYQEKNTLFALVLQLGADLNLYRDLLSVPIALYWQEHYNFERPSKKSSKKLSKNFVDLLIINAIVPVLFCYAQQQGKDCYHLLELMYAISPEKNSIINRFKKTGVKVDTALHTQALLTLKSEYCEKERCAECVIGIACIKN